jgi:hypothetical protein
MKYFILPIVLLILLMNTGLAQDKGYFSKLNSLQKEIVAGGKQGIQFEYLSIFPSSFEKFLKTFDYFPEKKVSNLHEKSYEHISTISKISEKHPEKVMKLMFQIAIDGSWEADAVNYLQHSLAKLIAKRTDLFLGAFSEISKEKQKGIIRFLADIENHDHYEEYKVILKNLRKKDNKYYNGFLTAKKKRMKDRH